jgi:hypothetical protein
MPFRCLREPVLYQFEIEVSISDLNIISLFYDVKSKKGSQLRTFLSLFVLLTLSVFAQDSTFNKISMMKDSISLDNIYNHIANLEYAGGHYSRVTFTPGKDSAAAYIREQFESIPGLIVEIDTFYIPEARSPYNEKPLFNIIATIPGQVNPNRQFIIGAHYDASASRMGSSVWNSGWDTINAPGADDNATGVAAIIEMARVLSDTSINYTSNFTIKLIAYAAEEYNPSYSDHHLGSVRHAKQLKANNEQVLGMISVDMVGYNSNFYTAIVAGNSQSFLGTKINFVRDLFNIDLRTNEPPFPVANYSDHWSYIDEGYSAVLLIENAPPWSNNPAEGYVANPFYHKTSDTLGTVNMELTKRVAQLALATAASFASVLSNVEDDFHPGEFRLAQNYPNPFNPRTTIRFDLPVRSDVQLRVYDILGKEIALLVNGEKEEGVHELSFNAAGLASGIYIYQIVTPGFSESRKMILLR